MKLAVFLLAGGGIRLKPYTNDIPKCLVSVNGQRLLIRMLNYLKRGGIEKVILVIGYKGEKIKEAIGNSWKGMEITYVNNPDWATTNNVVSLNIAVPSINEDFILLEGDLIFTWEAFKNMLTPNKIAVDNYKHFMNGTLVSIGDDNFIKKFVLKADQNNLPNINDLYKTINIYSFKYDSFIELIVPKLKNLINSGHKQVYYEQAIAETVSENKYLLEAVNFNGTSWYEIDTEEDLLKAEDLFNDISF